MLSIMIEYMQPVACTLQNTAMPKSLTFKAQEEARQV